MPSDAAFSAVSINANRKQRSDVIWSGFRLCRRGCPCKRSLFNCILQPTGSSSDVISGRFCEADCPREVCKISWYFCVNHSRGFQGQAVGRGIFDSFFRYNFRQEVDSDVISGVAVDYVPCRYECSWKILWVWVKRFSRYSRGWFRVERTYIIDQPHI